MPSATTVPKPSSLAEDPTLAPFLQPTFSPIDYLNSTLPIWMPTSSNPTISSLQSSSTISIQPTPTPSTTQTQPTRVSTLSDLHTQTQAQLSTLDAKLARLSSTLTSLTDEILRCGGRLAYEVEILGADAGGLSEVLRRGRSDDSSIGRFLNGEVGFQDVEGSGEGQDEDGTVDESVMKQKEERSARGVRRPEALEQLHTLTLLRTRLTTVITTFDAAIAWPLPPSSTTASRNFISVSAPSQPKPTNGSKEDAESKGQAFETQTKEEIADLLEDGEEGVQAAKTKVRELRELCEVWKGTVEERPRGRFVEGLARMVAAAEGGEG